MEKPEDRKHRAGFKRSVLTGLAALLPVILTIFLIVWCWNFLAAKVGTPINNSIKSRLSTQGGKAFLKDRLGWLPDRVDNDAVLQRELDKHFPNYVGLAVAFLIGIFGLYVIGFLLATFVGRRLFRLAERFLVKFPIVKQIYPYAKQISEFLFASKKSKFSRVVAVEYPRKSVYSLGFVTGNGVGQITDASGHEMVNVFIPSSPTPITGYVVFVPADEVVPLDLTVDEALRLTISGGVLVPHRQASGVPVDSDTQSLMALPRRASLPKPPKKRRPAGK